MLTATPEPVPLPLPPPSAEWRTQVLGLDEGHHPKVAALARNAEWFARACLRENRTMGHWWVIAGGVGCGKTHVARRVRDYAGAQQVAAWFAGWLGGDHIAVPLFLRWEVVSAWARDRWEDYAANEIAEARLVIVDDIGSEVDKFKTEETKERLKLMLDCCERKWLLVTTNVPKTKWQEKWSDRVADRLNQARYLALFDVPSYRGKKE